MLEVFVFVAFMIVLKLVLSRFRVSWKELLKNSVILFILLTIFLSILDPTQLKFTSLSVLTVGFVLSLRQMIVYDVEMIEMVIRLSIMICLILNLTTNSRVFLYIMIILSVPWMFYLFKYKRTAENLILCIENSARVSRKGCEWSSKPIVVEGDFRKRIAIGAKGILVITRKGKALVLVKRSAHERLERPCLNEFSQRLISCLFGDGFDVRRL